MRYILNLIKLEETLNLGMKLPVYFHKDLSLLLITHMIRADIETEVSPIVGSEKQSEELVNYYYQNLRAIQLKYGNQIYSERICMN